MLVSGCLVPAPKQARAVPGRRERAAAAAFLQGFGILVDAPELQDIPGFAAAEPRDTGWEQKLNPEVTTFQECFLRNAPLLS